MFHHWRSASNLTSPASRASSRRPRCLRPILAGALEDRVLLAGFPVIPTEYTVNLTSDTGTSTGFDRVTNTPSGDLLWAVTQANANSNPDGSIIEFDPTIFNGSTSQTIYLTKTLTLTETAGPIQIQAPSQSGLGQTVVGITGQAAVTVFDINAGVTATLSSLTIAGGQSSGNGGGVLNQGNLTVINCTITKNTAVGSGGGIENNGSMEVSGSIISGNTAEAATGYGGGIASNSSLGIYGCEIMNNNVSGAGGNGGGIYSAANLIIDKSAIINNSVSAGDGGGVFCSSTASITSSTIENNSTGAGDGKGGGIDNSGIF